MAKYGKATGRGLFQPGFRLLKGDDANRALSRIFQGGLASQDNITAMAGGGKTLLFQLTNTMNRVTTVASANDAVGLPSAISGSVAFVTNSGAQNLAVYSNGADTINGNAAATSDVIPTGKTRMYLCYTKGQWFTFISA